MKRVWLILVLILSYVYALGQEVAINRVIEKIYSQLMETSESEIDYSDLYDDLIVEIRKVSLQVDGVESTEKCFIRKAGMKYHVDLHAIVNANITVREGHDISHLLKDTLRAEIPELGHVLIHIEPSYY